jgi:hypothetical protein
VALAVVLLTWQGNPDSGAPAETRSTPVAIPSPSPTSTSSLTPCLAAQITVTGNAGHQPGIDVPNSCSPPAQLASEDIIKGKGDWQVPDNDPNLNIEVKTEVVTWSGRPVMSDWNSHRANTQVVGQNGADGLAGMRIGGRRVIVVPPQNVVWSKMTGDPWPDETVVMVVDVIGSYYRS